MKTISLIFQNIPHCCVYMYTFWTMTGALHTHFTTQNNLQSHRVNNTAISHNKPCCPLRPVHSVHSCSVWLMTSRPGPCGRTSVFTPRLRFKCHPILFIVHFLRPEPIGSIKVMHPHQTHHQAPDCNPEPCRLTCHHSAGLLNPVPASVPLRLPPCHSVYPRPFINYQPGPSQFDPSRPIHLEYTQRHTVK